MSDDDDIFIETGELVLLPPGDWYEAICTRIKRVEYFQRGCLEFLFQLVGDGMGHQKFLTGYCPLGRRAREHSKIARWQRAISAYTKGSPSKVPLKAFKQYQFRVRVETVDRDHRQQKLLLHNQYSKVGDILEVIGPLKADG